MSSDDPSNVPAPNDRRHAVREKAQQVRARQSRAHRIRTVSIITAVAAIVAVVAVTVVWTFTSETSRPQLQPSNFTHDGFAVASVDGLVAVAGSGGTVDGTQTSSPAPAEESAAPAPRETTAAPVDIRVYIDYLSPTSREFQVSNVQQLAKWVEDDAATLTYYPVAMLTAKSNGTKYSLRAASAAACVATHSPDSFFAFNDSLLTQQPAVDSDGLTDVQLADLAQASGSDAPKVVRACIEEQRFAAWARDATDRALKGLQGAEDIALTGTPTILVNGTPYVGAPGDPKEFAQFVLTVASDSYYQTPTPTPTATPVPSDTAAPAPSS